MESLNTFGVILRRAITLAIGEGPRQVTSLLPIGRQCELLHNEPGETFPAPACQLVTPDLVGPVVSWPLKTQHAPSRRVWSVRRAGLYDDDGVIYDLGTRRAFVETLDYWGKSARQHPALALRRGIPVRQLDGLTVFLGGLGGQTFYHFLVEIAPKIPLLLPWLKQAKRVVVQNYLETSKTAWLEQFGLDLPIEWLQPLSHFHCEQLVFCPPLVSECRPGPQNIAALRLICGTGQVSARTRCIWATRLKDQVRNMPWEADLIRALPATWEIIDFGRLTPAEAIALGENCACFAGLHGAAFANLSLWPPGVRALEVYTKPHEPWYPALSLSAGHHHEVVFAHHAGAIPAVIKRLIQLSESVS